MQTNSEENTILQKLCDKHGVGIDKIHKLLKTVQDNELKDKRIGIYDTLEEIIKQKGDSINGENRYH